MKRTRPISSKKNTPSKFSKNKKASTLAMYKYPSNNNAVRLVRRNVDFFQIVASNTVITTGTYSFRLSSVPNSAELISMYDQYKINAVQLTFYPRMTQITSLINPDNVANRRILTVIDYTDGSPPASTDELREYENCEVRSCLETFSVYIDKPRFADASGALRSGYISTSSPSTVHYGLKYAVDPLNPGVAGTYPFTVEAVFYMSFKAIK